VTAPARALASQIEPDEDDLLQGMLPQLLPPQPQEPAMAAAQPQGMPQGVPQPQEPDKDELLKLSAREAAEEEGTPSPDDIREIERAALVALYGPSCPLASDIPPTNDDWVAWARRLWDDLTSGVQKRLHLTERNRLFRRGVQWVSSHGLGPWREPPKPRDAARVVYNMIDKALDQRLQIIAEQRPASARSRRRKTPTTSSAPRRSSSRSNTSTTSRTWRA
jgi:hypothetical protein